MHTEDMHQHHNVLVQLAGPAISQLSIAMHVCPSLSLCKHSGAKFRAYQMSFSNIQFPPGPLPAPMIADLPISKYLSLDLACGTRQDIAWAALCQCACSIRIKLETSQTLCVHGCPWTMLSGHWGAMAAADSIVMGQAASLAFQNPHVKRYPDFDLVRCRYSNATAAALGSRWY